MTIYKTRLQKGARVNYLAQWLSSNGAHLTPVSERSRSEQRMVSELAVLSAQIASPTLEAATVWITALFGGVPMYRVITERNRESEARDYCVLGDQITVKKSNGRVLELSEARHAKTRGVIRGSIEAAIAAGLSWENPAAVVVPFKA